jgi:CRP-like cAMP-binding protein
MDLNSLVKSTKSIPFFQQLNNALHRSLCAVLEYEKYQTGDLISHQDGDPKFSVIMWGKVNFHDASTIGALDPHTFASSKQPHKSPVHICEQHEKAFGKVDHVLERGDAFGEKYMEGNGSQVHNENCTAAAMTELIVLHKKDFRDLVTQSKDIVFNPSACRAALALTPEDRSEHDIENISLFCAKIQFFAQIPDKMSRKLFKRMTLHTFQTDDVIFLQGDPGTLFYVILTGSVRVYIRDLTEMKTENDYGKCVARMFMGDTFGEKALISDVPRSATIKCQENTELIVLKRDDYRIFSKLDILFSPRRCMDALKIAPSKRNEAEIAYIEEYLPHLDFFRQMPKALVKVVSRNVEYLDILADEVVFEEGAYADGMFIILTGSVSVYIKEKKTYDVDAEDCVHSLVGGHSLQSDDAKGVLHQKNLKLGVCVAVLSTADIFGENGLSLQGCDDPRGKRRNASIVTKSDCELIFLNKNFCNEKLSHFGTFQPSLCRTILQKKPIDRSPTDLLNISKMLTTIDFFKQLDADTIQKLGRVLVLQEFDPDVPIFVQGEPGEDFYIILRGNVEIFIKAKTTVAENVEKARNKLKLLTQTKRLAHLRKSGVDLPPPSQPETASTASLSHSPPASNPRSSDPKPGSQKNRRKTSYVRANDVKGIHARASGIRGMFGSKIGDLAVGDSFGELAILEGKMRSASIVTTSTTEVVKLFKDDYDRILGTFSHDINFQRSRGIMKTRQLADDWNDSNLHEDCPVTLKHRKTKMLQVATRGHAFFAESPEAYHDPLQNRLKNFDAQEVIFSFQSTAKYVFILLYGVVDLFDEDNNKIASVKEGAFGHLGALWSQHKHICKAVAVDSCTCLLHSKVPFYLTSV